MLDCYIINLDRSKERWEKVSANFRDLGMNVVRVPAVDGSKMVKYPSDFSPWQFFLLFGRKIRTNEVACFMSHIKALRTFLDSDQPYALVCEDDVQSVPELPELLKEVLRYSDAWDLVRLNGSIRPHKGINFAKLSEQYSLCSHTQSVSGAGAVLYSRYAAQRILKKLVPMRLPYDVALYFDRPIGIREIAVRPYPISWDNQIADDSTIDSDPNSKRRDRYPLFHPVALRYLTVIPYKIGSRALRLLSRHFWALRRFYFPPQPRY